MARLAVRSLFIALVTLVMIEGVGTEWETLESPPRVNAHTRWDQHTNEACM